MAQLTTTLDKFVSAPDELVSSMFDLADIKSGDMHIDLGSGNGKMMVEAINRGAISVGYETNKTLVVIPIT